MVRCDCCGSKARVVFEYDAVTHYFCDECAPAVRPLEVEGDEAC